MNRPAEGFVQRDVWPPSERVGRCAVSRLGVGVAQLPHAPDARRPLAGAPFTPAGFSGRFPPWLAGLLIALASPSVWTDPSVAAEKPVVAVAEVRISTPSAQLHFSEDGVRDVLTAALAERGVFQVMDWSRLAAVAFRRNLGSSDLVAEAPESELSKDVLLNEYFLLCTVNHYSERVDYKSGGLSKSKRQVADIELQLLLKDAFTNEVVASAAGAAQRERKVSQHLGFGAGGGAVSTLSKDALHGALEDALGDLVQKAFGPRSGGSDSSSHPI